MKYILQKSFALAALSLMCIQPVFAALRSEVKPPATNYATLHEAETKCKDEKGHLTVTPVAGRAGYVRYVCMIKGGIYFWGTTTLPQPIPQQGTTAPAPVVPRAGLATTPVVPKTMMHDTRKTVIQNFRALWLTPSKPSYRTARLVTRPGVIGASMEVTCEGGKTFTVSTGDAGGACGATIGENGNVSGGMCGSASGSGGGSASVSCSANNGQGACTGSSGSGSCGETRP